ncbi:MAG: DUF4199 domain-containing protein [Gemmataceae bacterium]
MSLDEELERVDAEWEKEKQQYLVTDQNGRQHVPDAQGAVVFAQAARRRLAMGILMAVVGIIWTFFALALTRTSHIVVHILLPGFGVLFVAVALRSTRNFCRMMGELQRQHEELAVKYQQALTAYQTRRGEIEASSR